MVVPFGALGVLFAVIETATKITTKSNIRTVGIINFDFI
jgi:hypothetical protein